VTRCYDHGYVWLIHLRDKDSVPCRNIHAGWMGLFEVAGMPEDLVKNIKISKTINITNYP
jgi:hypothetical protein